MKHPTYHLRPNKAVDRLTLIDTIRGLGRFCDLSKCVYYGMGGPYLEDFRLLYEFYPEIKMVSVEVDENTFKRQRFHMPCTASRLQLKKSDFGSFLTQFDPQNKTSIFWLDYTGLEYACFEDFMVLLGKVTSNSIIKITLRSEPRDFRDKAEEFRKKFEALMPDSSTNPPRQAENFAKLIQDMVQIAAQKVLPSAMPMMFLPISSFRYADGNGMFTLTGIVCMRSDEVDIRRIFKNHRFANLNWNKPTVIDVPTLSTKERLHLQRRLPCARKDAGRVLRNALGYLIDKDSDSSDVRLQQYADFHGYFPYFIKAVP